MYSCRWDWNLRGKGALGVSNLRLETSDCRGRQPELLTTLGGCRKGGAKEAAEKRPNTVILRSSGDEESRTASKTLRARFFAALRMTANELRITGAARTCFLGPRLSLVNPGRAADLKNRSALLLLLRMTPWTSFSAAFKAPPFRQPLPSVVRNTG